MIQELLKRDDYTISIDTDANKYLLFERGEKIGSYNTFEGADKAIDRKTKQEKMKPLEAYAARGWSGKGDYEKSVVTSAKLEKSNYGSSADLVVRVTFKKDGERRKINLRSSKIVKENEKNEERIRTINAIKKEIEGKEEQITKIKEGLERLSNEEIMKYFKVAE